MTNLDSMLKCRNVTLPAKVHSQNYGFSSSHVMHVRVGPKRRLSAEELMLLNCGVGKSLESLVLQGEQPVNPKENQS